MKKTVTEKAIKEGFSSFEDLNVFLITHYAKGRFRLADFLKSEDPWIYPDEYIELLEIENGKPDSEAFSNVEEMLKNIENDDSEENIEEVSIGDILRNKDKYVDISLEISQEIKDRFISHANLEGEYNFESFWKVLLNYYGADYFSVRELLTTEQAIDMYQSTL